MVATEVTTNPTITTLNARKEVIHFVSGKPPFLTPGRRVHSNEGPYDCRCCATTINPAEFTEDIPDCECDLPNDEKYVATNTEWCVHCEHGLLACCG